MLNAGDLLFVGWDADNNDIAFVTTTDLVAGDVIYFTDDEWTGTEFRGSEQLIEWTVPAGGIPAATFVTIDMDGANTTVTFDSGGDVDYIRGAFNIREDNEMYWAFQGTRVGDDVTPTNFIAVIGNEADGGFKISPNLTGTGLTTDNGAIIIDGDNDYMEWIGDADLTAPVDPADIRTSVLDLSNWQTAEGSGVNNPNVVGFDFGFGGVVCFANGTRIQTMHGRECRVEDLKVDDFVLTQDAGLQPVKWIGMRHVGRDELERNPKLRPVRIVAGALGGGLPKRDLLVSRQHRMQVSSKIAERMFGSSSVLVAAIKLTGLPGIYVDEHVEEVTYFHIMMQRHEVIFAENAPTESLFAEEWAMRALSEEGRQELLELFPEMANRHYAPEPARPIPSGRLQKHLVSRHAKNDKPLLM